MTATKQLSIRLSATGGERLRREFGELGGEGRRAFRKISDAAKPASAGIKAVDASARALNGVLRQAAGLMGAYAGIRGILASVRSIGETGMLFQGLGTALESITGSSAAARGEMAFLERQTDRLGLNLREAARGYMQITAAAQGTTLAGKGTREIFTAITEAATVLRMSADQTRGALRVVGQIMSKGKVQAEELRGQLGERLYGAFQLAARGMGVQTAELDKMLVHGKLASEDFLPKFAAEIRKTFAEGVPEASRSAQAEMNRFHNSLLKKLFPIPPR